MHPCSANSIPACLPPNSSFQRTKLTFNIIHDSLYCSSPCSRLAGAGSFSAFCFQMKMMASSSPEASRRPLGAQRTTFTAFWCRVRSAATSTCADPDSDWVRYQIWE